MHNALVFLTVCSIRNGVRMRLRRLRQPRYLIVALGITLYFGLLVFSRGQGAGITIPPRFESLATIAAGVAIAVLMGASWVMPSSAALQFSLADVHFLFPAPLTRRDLLVYKILRLFIGVAGTAVFFTLFAAQLRPFPAFVFFLKTTLILSLLGVYEAGVSLYRHNRKQSGALEGRNRYAVAAGGMALIAFSAVVLARFAFAAGGELLALLPLVVLGIAVAAVWVIRSDSAFEEEAAVLAEKVGTLLAGRQRPQPQVVTMRTARFSLAPRGPAETAILWKNWLLLTRGSSARFLGRSALLLLVIVAAVAMFGSAKGDPVAPVLGFVLAVIVVLIGPAIIRIDLRQDLANLPLIKTWPVSGAAVIRGEVLAPAIGLTAAAFAAIVIGGSLAPAGMLPAANVIGRLNLIVTATAAAGALIVAQLVIQNGIAALFPAWVQITPNAGGGGVEVMGQTMVVMYGGALALIAASVVPAAAAAIVFFVVGGILAPAAVFSALLFVEVYAATEIVGSILDRTDIQDVVVTR